MEASTIVIIAVASILGLVVLVGLVLFIIWWKMRGREMYSSRDVNRYLEENVPLMKEPPREQVEKEAELKAHYFLRASGRQVIEPLMTIGWRKNKFFWLITDFDPEQRKMLELLPNSMLNLTPTEKQLMCDCVKGLKHPLFAPATCELTSTKDAAFVVRPFYFRGSLRDRILDCDPKKTAAAKYESGRRGQRRTPHAIGAVGRQILEALMILQSIDWAFPHLHAGNVMVEKEKVVLTDTEDIMLGVVPFHDVVLKEVAEQDGEKPSNEVVCFGCVVYEMATGEVLKSIEEIKQREFHDQLKQIFNRIFFSDPEPATLADLLSHPLFDGDVGVDETQDKIDIPEHARAFLLQIKEGGPRSSSSHRSIKRKKSKTKGGTPRSTPRSLSRSTPSSERKKSSSSTSTSFSSGNAPVPPAAPSAKASEPSKPPPASSGRSALLQSIRSGTTLKKAETIDKSKPVLK